MMFYREKAERASEIYRRQVEREAERQRSLLIIIINL